MKKIFVIFIIFFLFKNMIYAKENYNYLALGDSITKGYGVKEEENYSYKIYEYLNKTYNVTYYNDAISGYDTNQFISLLENNNIINKIKNANLITLSIGSNDILKYLNIKLINQASLEFIDNIKNQIPKTKINLKYLINNIKTINKDVLLIIIPFYNPFNTLTPIITLNSTLTILNQTKDELNEYINTIINNYNNIYFDYDLIKILENKPNLLINYNQGVFDPHPNILGHEKIAKSIINVLENKKIDNTSFYIIYIILSIIIIFLIIVTIINIKNEKTIFKQKIYK